MNYTNNLPYSKLMAQVQANINNLKPNKLKQAQELLALMKAENNGAASLYQAILETALAGVEPTLVLQQARIAIQQHQADIEALSHAIAQLEAQQDSVTH